MQANRFEDFLIEVKNYINTAKLPQGKSVEYLFQTLDKFELNQKINFRELLSQEFHHICRPDPTSLPPFLLVVLEHGTVALKRACMIACIMYMTNYVLPQNFLNICALKQGITAGIVTFGVSILYENTNTTPPQKLKRLIQFKDKLKDLPAESPTNIKLKFS